MKILAVLWALPLFATAAPAETLAEAAGSPYTLARWFETHTTSDPYALQKALGANGDDAFLPPCEHVGNCTGLIIEIPKPRQVIVVIEHGASMFQVYLRYTPASQNRWHLEGAYSPYVKYFHPTHRIARVGPKPFLVIRHQGASGSGLSSTVESWIDLTQDGFTPALYLHPEGSLFPYPRNALGRQMRSMVASIQTQPTEIFTLQYRMRFFSIDENEREFDLGRRTDTVVFVRGRDGKFVFDPKRSTITQNDLDNIYGFDSDYTHENFLRFNLAGLRTFASSTNTAARTWLREYLKQCPPSPEAKELITLLDRRKAPRANVH